MHTDTISHTDILDLSRACRLYEGVHELEHRGWTIGLNLWAQLADRLTAAALYANVRGDRATFMRDRINDAAMRAGTRLLPPGWQGSRA